jgi:hypothetical protein
MLASSPCTVKSDGERRGWTGVLLKALWGLSFLWLVVSVYEARQGHGLLVIVLLWAFAFTMMAQRGLNYQRVRRRLK